MHILSSTDGIDTVLIMVHILVVPLFRRVEQSMILYAAIKVGGYELQFSLKGLVALAKSIKQGKLNLANCASLVTRACGRSFTLCKILAHRFPLLQMPNICFFCGKLDRTCHTPVALLHHLDKRAGAEVTTKTMIFVDKLLLCIETRLITVIS